MKASVVLACLWASGAAAQGNCADRETVVSRLESRYGEVFGGGGLQNDRQILEVWYSEEKGTWTVLMTRADGRSCIMASGANWREPGDVRLPGQKG